MPTYDYVCDACSHTCDVFQSIKDPVLTTCPACGEDKLRRKIGAGAGIIFKGSGFYETDYRSESYKKAAKADQEAGGNGKDKSKAKDGDKKTADTAVSKDTGSTDKKDSGSSGGKTNKSPKKEPASASGNR